MKKVLLTFVCACALTLGTVFAAQAETTGVYVAPKFLMMWQNNQVNIDGKVSAGPLRASGEWAEMFNSQFTLGGALAVGYDFYSQFKLPVRAELEFAMRGDNKKTKSDSIGGGFNGELKSVTNASTLMANFFYDFRNDSDFTPYVTAGAGLAFIRAENKLRVQNADLTYFDRSKSVTNFAWNLGAGVAYNFNENVAVDLGYRYVNMGVANMSSSYDFGSGVKGKLESDNYLYNHEIALGVRYTF